MRMMGTRTLLRQAFAFVLIAICAVHTGAWGQFGSGFPGTAGASLRNEQVQVELLAHAPQGVRAGDGDGAGSATVWVGLQIRHTPGWHTYWKNAGDSGSPTQLAWTLPPGVTAGEIVWPLPQKFPLGQLANYGYDGTVLLAVPLHIAPDFRAPPPLGDSLPIGLRADWLVCRQECLPQSADLALALPVNGSTALHGAAFDAARTAEPRALPGAHQARLSADGQRLTLRVAGLPAAVRGQTLTWFAETPNVLTTAAEPGPAPDAGHWTQRWDGAVWQAELPVSPQRADGPSRMPFVVATADAKGSGATAARQGWRLEAPVEGAWPALAPVAGVSPALEAALAANAARASAAGVAGTAAPATTPLGGSLGLALAAALLGGMLLNLMPCVFPVLAIKVLGFARHSDDRRAHRRAGLAYTAGVVLSFLALGALMLALRAAGQQLGWGFQLQSPAVVAALAALFTLLGLNLAGLFEFALLLPSRVASFEARHPTLNALLSGVLAVAVASPCTAPFMGASLGLAIALPAAQALALFAALGLGMALPYLLASWWPAVARALPRPGAWMQHFRQLMAFPMFGTAVWLVWVLGQQSGIHGAAALLALLVAGAMVLWAFGLPGRARWVLGALALACLAWLGSALGPLVWRPAQAAVPATTAAASASAARWQPWAAGEAERLAAAGTPVFVDYTAAWCVTCQFNKQNALADAGVLADFDARGVRLLRADWTRQDPAISAELQGLGRSGVPVYVLHRPGQPPLVLTELLSAGELHRALATLAS